jgi:hypothetical protein
MFPERVNGREVLFIGVDHEPAYFHANRDDFERLVRDSALMVLEHFPLEGSRLDRRDPLASADQTFVFYWLLLELAGASSKRVAVVDPDVGTGVHTLNWARAWAGVAAGAKVLWDGAGYLSHHRQVSRRKLLATSAMMVTAYSLTERNLRVTPLRLLRTLAWGPEDAIREWVEYGIDDALAYELLNYRDVCAAVGIDLLTRTAPTGTGPITVIYGRLHPRLIIAYLKHPAIERKAKLRLYFPFALLGDQALREYDFSDGQWALARRQSF